ncbi:hypothetical protein AMECASPLE_037488 [Ameca splendens]|uniref:Uncharacterized protein n=1 Tax=Ameca splendens TaxID=208324 RepID=A0ABV0Y7U7_9TELE
MFHEGSSPSWSPDLTQVQPKTKAVIPGSCVEFNLSDVFLWLNKPFNLSVLCLAESWVCLFLICNTINLLWRV